MDYFEELKKWQEQVARKTLLEGRKRKLKDRIEELEEKVSYLEGIMIKEQDDVEKFEGNAFMALLYKLVGKHGEKLSQEKCEAYEARIKYETAESELKALKDDLYDIDKELADLFGIEEKYEKEFEKKKQAIMLSNNEEAKEIFRLSDEISALEAHKKELAEAISAGKIAYSSADRVLASLEQAEDWGKADMWGFGGIISEIGKHSNLNDAQDSVAILQTNLVRFQNELSDTEIRAHVRLETDGYVKFADWFFDGFFSNWEMQSRIEASNQNVWSVKRDVGEIVKKLEQRSARIDREIGSLKHQLDEIVRNSAT